MGSYKTVDQFKRNVAKSKREVRIVLGFIVLLPFIMVLVMGYFAIQSQSKTMENYLEQERPGVVLAIDAYKVENGRYPDSITDAVPHYYKGQREQLRLFACYEYTNFGTNFFLKDFNYSR